MLDHREIRRIEGRADLFPSVSTGHGAIDGHPFQYNAVEAKWWTFVQTYLTSTFGEELIDFVDAARPAVDSAFFSWCWTSEV